MGSRGEERKGKERRQWERKGRGIRGPTFKGWGWEGKESGNEARERREEED